MRNNKAVEPLVTGPLPVRMMKRGSPPRPGLVLLFTTDDGEAVVVSRRPGALASMNYTYRYMVDTEDHVTAWTAALPSATGGFSFQAAMEARWKVTDPAEVVKRGVKSVADGDNGVSTAMRDLLWPHAGGYGIERLADFAAHVRTAFCQGRHRLDLGITVTALTVRVYLDDHAANHLRAVKQKEFDVELARAGHVVSMTNQQQEAELQTEREKAVLAAARGEGGLFVHLIAQDPGRLHEIMLELGNRHDIAVGQKSEILRTLIDAKLIQPAEAQAMWQEMNRPLPLFGAGPEPLAASTGPVPVQLPPGSAPPAGAPGQAPSPGGPPQAQVVAGTVVDPAAGGAPPRPRHRGGQAADPPDPADGRPASGAENAPGSANVTGATAVGRRRSGDRGDKDGSGR